MHRTPLVALVVGGILSLAPGRAVAALHASAPAGGGSGAFDVTVDLAGGLVSAGGLKVPIPLKAEERPAEADVSVEAIAIGHDKHVVHVRVPVRGDLAGGAWEAILAPGKGAPIFAGRTGRTEGDPGERTGKAIEVLQNGATSFVLVGDVREDLSLCGQTSTLLDPMAVYPTDLALHPATVQRVGPEARASAQAIEATDAGASPAVPLAKLLVARGSSVPGSLGAELTDGDPRTLWRERRPGVGQGEFVVMAAPRDVPIARMRVVVSPPGPPPANGAAPQSFYLLTPTKTFEVTLPDDAWLKPAESYEVAFPEPIDASCVALVLDAAQTRGLAHPDVGVAELIAYSEFDAPGATLDDVAKALSGARGFAAAQVLERAGDAALAAVQRAYAGLDERGRALAIDVAAAHDRCEEAAPLLAQALCERHGEAPRKAREKIERCAGAAPVLAESLRHDAATRACVAPTLAAIAPEAALDPIADAMQATPEAEGETRAVLREALAVALAASPAGKLAPLLTNAARSVAARLEVMRAAQGRLAEALAESDAVVAELTRAAPALRERYLLLGPLEAMARAGDKVAAARLADAAAHDEAWPVRAKAAGAGAGIPEVEAVLGEAEKDPEPRVREGALLALASPSGAASPAASVAEAASLLARDGWPFVRLQAVAVLAKAPAVPAIDDSLADALRDGSVGVRGAAVVALARHRSARHASELRARLDDPAEDAEVRSAAAQALGAVCDARSADRLTELARSLATPGGPEDQQDVALGALLGLAALKPADLPARLAPLLDKGAAENVREAAKRALAARSACAPR